MTTTLIGRYVALDVSNGSNADPNPPRYSDHGLLQIWRIDAGTLVKVTEAKIGGWGRASPGRATLAHCSSNAWSSSGWTSLPSRANV